MSLLLVAISGAWFYTRDTEDVPINRVEFGFNVTLNGASHTTEVPLRFRLRNPTKLDRSAAERGLSPNCPLHPYPQYPMWWQTGLPSRPGQQPNPNCQDCRDAFEVWHPADTARDLYFNHVLSNIFVTRVVIRNTGAVDLSPSASIVLDNNSPLRGAILNMDINDTERTFARDSRVNNGIDFRHYIWQGMFTATANVYPDTPLAKQNALNTMNTANGRLLNGNVRTVLEPDEYTVFTLVTWIDYDALIALQDEYENVFVPNPDEVEMTVFGMRLRITAVDLNMPV